MKKVKERVLAYGEVTGHAHRIDTDVYIDESNNTRVFEGASKISHEEHKSFTLPPKKMRSGIIQEQDHLQNLKREVID